MKKFAAEVAAHLQLRKQLRQPTRFHFAIASRLRQLNREDWLAVTQGQSFFFSPEYLNALESVCPENLEPRYALISDDEGPVAAVCMQIVRVSAAQVGGPARPERETGLRARLKEQVAQRILVCGNLLSYGMHAACFAPRCDTAQVWPAVAEALYRVRRAEKIGGQTDLVMVKDLHEAAYATSAAMGQLSYAAVETEPNMVLALEAGWKTHADYLGSLTSKYRSAVKQQVFKPFDEAGCELLRLDDPAQIDEHAHRLHALYLQVQGNASLRPFTLRPDYWGSLARAAAGRLAVHVARRDTEWLGFIATLKDGDTAYAYHIGFDRQAAGQGLPLYLRLLHASLAQSIDFGCREVSFGRTALEPKARLGCRPQPMRVWVRHRQPVLNQVVRPLLRFIQHDDAPAFNPFKKAGTTGDKAMQADA